MSLLCLDEICSCINCKESQIEDPIFALYYAPILAKEEKYAELDTLTRVNPYAALFKYPTAVKMKSQNICAKDFKEFLKAVIIDAQAFESVSEISKAITRFATTTISNTREYQKSNSILENAMTTYCPIVPYSQTLRRAEEGDSLKVTPSEVPEGIENFPAYYHECLNIDKRIQILRKLAICAPLAIIDTAGYYSSGVGVANIYQDLKWQDEKMQTAIIYWGLISLLSMDEPPQATLVENVWKGMNSLWATTPEKRSSFDTIFETMMEDTDLLPSTENWSALPQSDRHIANQYEDDNPNPNPYRQSDTPKTYFNVDKLVSQFNNRRGIMTNAVTTSYVESEWKDAGISDITAFNDRITLITFGDTWMGIPFVDISDNYAIKAMCINRDGDIKDFTCTPPRQ